MAKGKNNGTQHKAMRPTWEGHLRLSLVTCPVALYTATERSADVHFNMINPKTNNRIRMQSVDAGTGRAVERADLVRGFEVSKNKYVLFDKDELDAVKLESTRIIDIEEFVDANTIDRIYWDEPYYLAPSGKTGIEAFSVIDSTIFHFGVPSANAASRNAFGTSFSMFSVVRITIGICSNASANTPAQPLKCPIFATTSA